MENVNERNTMYVHYLVWDERYTDSFFKDLLSAVFYLTAFCTHLIIVLPPFVAPNEIFERHMIRIVPKGMKDSYNVQALYMAVRHSQAPKLNIRRVVEEDNDDVIPIIDALAPIFRRKYGDYYASELIRFGDDHRRLIVSEGDDGVATAVLSLNTDVNLPILQENFELTPYNGLAKPDARDRLPETARAVSEILQTVFTDQSRLSIVQETEIAADCESHDTLSFTGADTSEEIETIRDKGQSEPLRWKEGPASDVTGPKVKDPRNYASAKIECETSEIVATSVSFAARGDEAEKSAQPSKTTLLSGTVSIIDYLGYYQKANLRSKMRMSLFGDTVYTLPQKSSLPALKEDGTVSSRLMQEQAPASVFRGATNAFAIEIFATRSVIEQRSAVDYLEAAFECFPDCDYCIVLVPFSEPFFPLLEHFVRVPLRCDKDFPMTLYLAHKVTFFGRIKCRPGESHDRETIDRFLGTIPRKESILSAVDEIIRGDSDASIYVFECDDTLVGVAIVCSEREPEVTRARYRVDDFVCTREVPKDRYGRILHFVSMPIFSVRCRFFVREIMRIGEYVVLYHRVYEADCSALTRTRPLTSFLHAMMPVSPRKRVEYNFCGCRGLDSEFRDCQGSQGNDTKSEVKLEENFSLFLTTPRLSRIHDEIIDAKIVVIGASDCGVAFTEFLAFGFAKDHARFTNVTLISPRGLPFEKRRGPVESSMTPFKGRYCHDYRSVVPARAWINQIYGTVTGIDRKQKYVTVMNQGSLGYDYLVLACGLQYQRPILPREAEAREKGEITELETPWNCLTINDDTQASICLKKISVLTNNLERKRAIVVYGHSVECYCALQGLLEFGLPGSWITLVEPPLHRCESHDTVFFDDREVDAAVIKGIADNGIEVISGYRLIDWILASSLIETIELESRTKTKRVRCDALLNFHERTIDASIFLAICRAGLVFDGRLVIDPMCRTNDRFIFAAGTATKYSRRLYAENQQHGYYNSIEIGERLAWILRNTIDDHRHGRVEEASSEFQQDLPRFRMPLIVACALPGGYFYLHVRGPGKRAYRLVRISHDVYGDVMVTGTCASENGYFRLRLNCCDTVETITCASRKRFEVQHVIMMHGMHHRMLNDVKSRYKACRVHDFYSYFREPWAAALFHDRFSRLRAKNRAILSSQTGVPGDCLIDDCVRALQKSNWASISPEDRKYIESRYSGSVYQQRIQDELLDFLEHFEEELPVYCTSRTIRRILNDTEDSPLFSHVY